MKSRFSPQTLRVLEAFLQDAGEWSYGYEISRGTGLKSGTLYPILMRLEERRLLETRWEESEPGRPARHMYRLTPDGVSYAREQRRVAARSVEARAGGLASGSLSEAQS